MKWGLILMLACLAGCAIAITKEGSGVRIVSEKEREQCKFLGTVSGSMSMGSDTASDADSAMNEARNKVGKMGANGIRVINMHSNQAGSTVTVEALKCNFDNP